METPRHNTYEYKADRARQLVGEAGINEALRYFWLTENGVLSREAIDKISALQRKSNGALTEDGILGRRTLGRIRVLRDTTAWIEPIRIAERKSIDLSTIRENIWADWQTPFDDLVRKMWFREKNALALGGPCILVNAKTQQGIIISGGKVVDNFSVILWNGWVESVDTLSDMASLRSRGKTGASIVYHFDDTIIPSDPYANSSRSGRARGVIGATLCSPEGVAGGGRWFHWVPEWDTTTEWCIGMPVMIARRAATLVAWYGWWLGYVYNG